MSKKRKQQQPKAETPKAEEAPVRYDVVIEATAARALDSKRLDGQAATKMWEHIEGLATDPRPHGTKALTGAQSGNYRIRISAPGGEYRVVWSIDDKARRVTVTEAGPRESTYGR